jgi:hypothetical protein
MKNSASAKVAPPTAEQLKAANMALLPNAALVAKQNGWARRVWNGTRFSLASKGTTIDTPLYAVPNYEQPNVPTPLPAVTFSAKQVGTGQVQVNWTGFSPVKIGRDGVDSNGFGVWDTGALTGEPMTGHFTFNSLVGPTAKTTRRTPSNLVIRCSVCSSTPMP